jgi:hypothetical protein
MHVTYKADEHDEHWAWGITGMVAYGPKKANTEKKG